MNPPANRVGQVSLVECPCKDYQSIERIVESLDSTDQIHNILEWLAGSLESNNNNNKAGGNDYRLSCQAVSNVRCRNRASTSLSILKAIRESCSHFLATGNSTPAQTTQAKPISYEETFPALGARTTQQQQQQQQRQPSTIAVRRKHKKQQNNQTKKQHQGRGQPKRRVQLVGVNPSSHTKGNIAMLPSEPLTERQDTPIGKCEEPSSLLVPRQIQNETSSRASTPASETRTDSKPVAQSTEPPVDLPVTRIRNLSRVFSSLVLNQLVSSTPAELQFIVQLLSLPPTAATPQKTEPHLLGELFATPHHCHCFASEAFSRLKSVLAALDPKLVGRLIGSPPFLKHLAELSEELKTSLEKREEEMLRWETREGSSFVVGASVTQPLFTQQFDPERDSRHKFKSKEEAASFKNREESRDAFLYQLRFFQGVRGNTLNSAKLQESMQSIGKAAANIVENVRRSNMHWFVEFFCDVLVQIGLVPMEETDQDLLRLTDPNKLQKLHKRFSAPVRATKRGRNKGNHHQREPEGVSPTKGAQRYFLKGHQEFFFTFVLGAASYPFAIHLRSRLYSCISNLSSNDDVKGLEERIQQLQLLAKFLGLVTFHATWHRLEEWKIADRMSAQEKAVWLQATKLDFSVENVLDSAWKSRQLVVVVPWISELLRMAKWDLVSVTSLSFQRVLAKFRWIHRWLPHQHDIYGPTKNLLMFTLESLLDDLIGVLAAEQLPELRIEASDEGSDQALSLDCVSLRLRQSELLHSSPELEDLETMALELNSTSSISTGVSRRLRPSTLSDKVERKIEKDDGYAGVAKENTSLGNQTEAVARLRDVFFLQHRDLRELCDFVVDRVVKNATIVLKDETISQRLKKELDALGLTNKVPTDAIMSQCESIVYSAIEPDVQAQIEGQIRSSMSVLVPPTHHGRVSDIAESLAIAHATKLAGRTVRARVHSLSRRLLATVVASKKSNPKQTANASKKVEPKQTADASKKVEPKQTATKQTAEALKPKQRATEPSSAAAAQLQTDE